MNGTKKKKGTADTNIKKTQKDTKRHRQMSHQVGKCPICYWGRADAITNSPRKNEVVDKSGNDAQLWMYLAVKVKSDAVKNNTAQEPGMLGP